MTNKKSVYYQRFKTDSERFWEKVNVVGKKEDACWEWLASKNKKGYGLFRYQNKNVSTHRYSWILHYGEIPDELFVLHKCDNPSCVNPKHLFLGTNEDNMKDMSRKGRSGAMSGNLHPNSKLSEDIVVEIFNLKKNGLLGKEIADIYNVTPQLISGILNGKGWKHVTA